MLLHRDSIPFNIDEEQKALLKASSARLKLSIGEEPTKEEQKTLNSINQLIESKLSTENIVSLVVNEKGLGMEEVTF